MAKLKVPSDSTASTTRKERDFDYSGPSARLDWRLHLSSKKIGNCSNRRFFSEVRRSFRRTLKLVTSTTQNRIASPQGQIQMTGRGTNAVDDGPRLCSKTRVISAAAMRVVGVLLFGKPILSYETYFTLREGGCRTINSCMTCPVWTYSDHQWWTLQRCSRKNKRNYCIFE